MKVIKRDGQSVEFDASKIEKAILKAMQCGSGIVDSKCAHDIAVEIENWHQFSDNNISIYRIEGQVFEKLIEKGQILTAKAYEGYRKVREFQRETNTIDKEIYGIVNQTNKEAMEENSNKDATVLATQRDLIAGEFSKDYCRRLLLPPKIVQAHDDGIIHFHDMDYYIQKMHNCDLVNLKDMFAKGTVINDKLIETPKSLQTACTVATQIVQQVANGQYGGQTISLAHLSPYVRLSYEKHQRNVRNVFMYLREEPEYIEETAMLIEETLKQRFIGMKNPVGAYVTPAFPKLLYVLDDNNVPQDSKYRYLTDLAVKCVSKRMMPDFISAKIMRENYEGQVFPCMGCRSFLSPWKDENGEYKWYGRFNQGVVTLNLADAGLSANHKLDNFWKILDERLELCKEALMLRHESLKGTLADVSPIHWRYGALARLESGEPIDKLLENGYSTISLGYIGLYECVVALIGQTHTSKEGNELATKIMERLRSACDSWKEETGLGFGLYGTPAESTTYTFARALKKRFGIVEGITDKDYLTNSYHVNVKEHIDAFDKLQVEAKFQKVSSGGAISYVEVTNMSENLDALSALIDYMYNTIQYAEINTKSDYCQECGFDGEILLDENREWYCPNCGNRNHKTLNVCRRTCGYLGDNFWNQGRTQEIAERFVHLDNHLYGE